MSETKWTPGPWKAGLPAQGVNPHRQMYIHAGGELIACAMAGYIHYDEDGASWKITPEALEANACLIAAAPDLYAALENLLTIVEVGIDTGTFELAGSLTYAPGDARAALKKARGDQ